MRRVDPRKTPPRLNECHEVGKLSRFAERLRRVSQRVFSGECVRKAATVA